MSGRRDEGLFPLVVAALFVAAAIAAFLVPWGTFLSWLAKGKPPAEVFAFIVTPLGAVAAFIGVMINRHSAIETLRHAQRAELASRFQKGVELLASPADAVKLGGIELLSSVAVEAPTEFQSPIIRALRQFLVEQGAPAFDELERHGQEGGSHFPPSGLPMTTALGAIARTPRENRWGGLEYHYDKLRIRRLYLNSADHIASDLKRVWLVKALFGDVWFVDCTFEDTILEATLFGTVTFENCRILRSNFDLIDIDVGRGKDYDPSRRLEIMPNCTVRDLIVNEKPWELPARRNTRDEPS